MGAWIETGNDKLEGISSIVAPYVGAWIETIMFCFFVLTMQVAPYVGAWIETYQSVSSGHSVSRTLRGCVD